MGPATLALIAANIAVFVLQSAIGEQLTITFALWPYGTFDLQNGGTIELFRYWQLVTSAFMHGSTTHLAFNMFGLWMFGRDVETVLGTRGYLSLYAAAVLTGSIAQLVVVSMSDGPVYPTVGASGGVFGVLLAFGMMFPRRMVMLLFPPIPMRAWVLVTVYGAIELFMGITGTQAGVAHFAHLGGMAGGFLLIQYWRGRLPMRPGRR